MTWTNLNTTIYGLFRPHQSTIYWIFRNDQMEKSNMGKNTKSNKKRTYTVLVVIAHFPLLCASFIFLKTKWQPFPSRQSGSLPLIFGEKFMHGLFLLGKSMRGVLTPQVAACLLFKSLFLFLYATTFHVFLMRDCATFELVCFLYSNPSCVNIWLPFPYNHQLCPLEPTKNPHHL